MQALDPVQDLHASAIQPAAQGRPEGRAGGSAHPMAAPLDAYPALSPRVLEDRRLIHRSAGVRHHADAFRQLRTRLLALHPHGNFVTLVVPVNPRCGGSFVARNLAAAFAFDEAKQALLVDCDARYPSQHRALEVQPRAGLVDYLSGHGVDVASLVHPTGLPRLDLVPFGTPRESASDAFMSSRMRTAIDSLRGPRGNRYLILDGPAVAGAPDARILSDLADLVVLVAGHGRTTHADVERAASGFEPGKVAGVVFNSGV